ncbi:MAG: hypothetical protein ACRD2W_11285 [Acidimicrobiales bacterium]
MRAPFISLVTGLAVAALTAPATATPPGVDDHPLQAAGKAAEEVAFVGVLEVRWAEGGTDRLEILLVQGGNGAVVVKGGTNVMASAQQRFVEHAGRWDLLSPVGGTADGRPAPGAKYQLSSSAGPLVTNRATRLVEVRDAGALLERLYLDDVTGLLLRREQFEGAGTAPTRTIQFDTITIGGAAPVPTPPASVHDASPKPVSASRLPDGVSAPSSLAGGYQRVGLYERSGVVQVRYSDGLYDLSVFEQPGRIDRSNLPDGTTVTFGTESARRYSWTGNHVLLWEEDGMVYTAVSDAPLAQVLAAVGSLPLSHVSSAIVRRLRQVARALVQPFAA